MKLNTIHHVAIIVSDYERAKEFYVGKLGFQVLRENYQSRRGSYKLDLKAGDQRPQARHKSGGLRPAPPVLSGGERRGSRPGAGGAGNRSHAYPLGRLHRGKAVFLF